MDIAAQFLSMLTLVFAIASFIAGVFTAYFGSGKSRLVGAILMGIGIIVFCVFLYGAGYLGSVPAGSIFDFKGTILQGVVAIVGALVGAGIALGIFLLAIMKA